MLWGPKQIGDFTSLVKPGYANIALGFNECVLLPQKTFFCPLVLICPADPIRQANLILARSMERNSGNNTFSRWRIRDINWARQHALMRPRA
jgi:hypothetical protein